MSDSSSRPPRRTNLVLLHARQEFRRPASGSASSRRRTGDAAGTYLVHEKEHSTRATAPGSSPSGHRCNAMQALEPWIPFRSPLQGCNPSPARINLPACVCSEIGETRLFSEKRPERSRHRLDISVNCSMQVLSARCCPVAGSLHPASRAPVLASLVLQACIAVVAVATRPVVRPGKS
jgi:hypothetical protein